MKLIPFAERLRRYEANKRKQTDLRVCVFQTNEWARKHGLLPSDESQTELRERIKRYRKGTK